MLKGYGSRPISKVDHQACALASECAYTGAGNHRGQHLQRVLAAVPAGIQAVLAQEHYYCFFFSPLPSSLGIFSLPLSVYSLMWPQCKGSYRVMGSDAFAGWITHAPWGPNKGVW